MRTEKDIIPNGWTTKKVSQVFDFLSTNSFSRSHMNYEVKDDSIYNIHYGDIHATYVEPILDLDKNKDIPVINNDVVIPNSVSFLKDGDVVMADASEDYAGVGETIELKNVQQKKIIAGLHTFALRDKDRESVEGYRTYLFKHPKVSTAVKVIATGSKVYGISKTNLSKINLYLPPLPEQQKIVTILSTWDKAIDKLTQLIATKEQRKKGLMQQLLTGKKRFTGFTEEWKEVKLGQILTIGSGKDYKHLGNGDIPVYGTGGLMTYVDEFLYQGESVGIGRKGTIDKPQYINGRFWTVDTLFYTHSFKNSIPKYVYFLFLTINWKRYNEASGVPSLSKSTIEKINVKVPSISEQQKITSVLSAADKEIELLKKELKSLQQQKTGFMQVLLTGEVRVKI